MKIEDWRQGKELEIAEYFDDDKELEVTILDKNKFHNDSSLWLTKPQIKRMIEHLVNVL
jgi:hypothetical protein